MDVGNGSKSDETQAAGRSVRAFDQAQVDMAQKSDAYTEFGKI